MNLPPNTRPFDINLAQQGHNLVTRDNRPAKFIAYVPELAIGFQLIVNVHNRPVSLYAEGYKEQGLKSDEDLFLAPLGHCEGLPVFAGDNINYIGDGLSNPVKVSVEDNQSFFDACKWPSKIPVAESKLSYEELEEYYFKHAQKNDGRDGVYEEHHVTTWDSISARNLANKAIERAILDGDVIPTSVVKELMRKTAMDFTKPGTLQTMIDDKVEKYLEGLK